MTCLPGLRMGLAQQHHNFLLEHHWAFWEPQKLVVFEARRPPELSLNNFWTWEVGLRSKKRLQL